MFINDKCVMFMNSSPSSELLYLLCSHYLPLSTLFSVVTLPLVCSLSSRFPHFSIIYLCLLLFHCLFVSVHHCQTLSTFFLISPSFVRRFSQWFSVFLFMSTIFLPLSTFKLLVYFDIYLFITFSTVFLILSAVSPMLKPFLESGA